MAKSESAKFFSARLLLIILVDDGKLRKRNHYDESTFIFRARDFEGALKRALSLGKAREVTYENSRGQAVRWAFVSVLTLDVVGRKIDGAEVSSRLHYRVSRRPVAYRTRFHPEKSTPSKSF